MTTSTNCPCGNSNTYQQCCGLYIDDKKYPETAEALMRSRYTAYTRLNDEYLLDTWHPDTRPSYKPTEVEDKDTTWKSLEVLRTEDGLKNDTTGIVEFIACCDVKGSSTHLHETSKFVRENGRWYYVDGEGLQPIKRETPKVGRNEPCPCGSNKKYKKCCGR